MGFQFKFLKSLQIYRKMLTILIKILLLSNAVHMRHFLVETKDSQEKHGDYEYKVTEDGELFRVDWKPGEKNNADKVLGLTIDEANELVQKEETYFEGQKIEVVD